jgi:tRNA threonylcarbamoyladenosine biosynthesis protein TsaE
MNKKAAQLIQIPGIYQTHSEKETIQLARKLARTFKGQEIVYLIGELGAGKTVFAKGLAAGLGLKDINQVCSPSFTLVNIYPGRWPIFHLDLYRINTADDLASIGWEDFLGQGVIIIEWGEKLGVDLGGIEVKLIILDEHLRRIELKKKKGN